MLSKSELIEELAEMTELPKKDVKDVLNTMAELAADEITQGEDFMVPGICRVVYRYTKPKKKGQEYPAFGGETKVAEKNTPAKIRLAATAQGSLKKIGKAVTLTSKAGKAIAARKG